MYSVKDVLKKSFLNGYNSADINLTTVVVALGITATIALYIFLIYRIICRKTFYSKNFNVSLVCVAVITAGIIVTIQSSIVVSLGMVGALSIVRFRTAIKEPMDLVFLFWAIGTGIMCGAGFSTYSIALAIVLTVVIFVLNIIPSVKASTLLIINSNVYDNEEIIIEKVKEHTESFKIKSRNVSASSLDMVLEIRSKDEGELIQTLVKVDGIVHASIVEHSGEATF